MLITSTWTGCSYNKARVKYYGITTEGRAEAVLFSYDKMIEKSSMGIMSAEDIIVFEEAVGNLDEPAIEKIMNDFPNIKLLLLGQTAYDEMQVNVPRRLSALDGIKDSKKLSAKKREEWFKKINGHEEFEAHHVYVSNEMIDKFGIRPAVIFGVEKVLEKFSKKPDLVLLDGLLHAPEKYTQETIIKGDEKVPLIAAASIIAKVSRDRVMMAMHEKYPQYNFAKHKGYGTKEHFERIAAHGLSPIHRKTFCHVD